MQRTQVDLLLRAAPALVAALLCLAALAIFRTNLQMVCAVGALVLSFVLAAVIYFARERISEEEDSTQSARARIELIESGIRRRRDALDALADGLDNMIFLVNRQAEIEYANAKVKQAFNFEKPEGQSLLAVTFSQELNGLVVAALRTNQSERSEITFHHPEERIGIAQAWVSEAMADRVFIAIYDITGLRRLERVRRDFVANVSHELRTPMATIRVMAETLQDAADEPELQVRYLDKIIREVDRLTSITDDLLTLSAAETGDATVNLINASEIVHSVCHQLEQKVADKGLRMEVNAPLGIEIVSSESQFTQIVMNLVDNAINYTQEGMVKVSLSDTSLELKLTVEDTGIGISSEHKSRIFERFYRVDKGRSRASGGTGLGLSIVRNMVESHGGKIGVESELNHGSIFTVILPKDQNQV